MCARILCLVGLWAIAGAYGQDSKAIVPIQVSHKIALVIGNAQYRSQSKLANTENDETDMAAVLRGLSFDEVLEGRNLSLRDMDRLLQQFFAKIHAGDLAFFYYSGHGMSEGEENYLLPVDFAADSDMSLDFRAFPVSKLRDKLEGSGARLRVMVLDACRSNPYSKSKGDTGLTRLEPKAEGTIIAFAAEHGKVAFETNGRNSRYTAALLDAFRNPQTHLREMFFDVQSRVYEESGERQKPAVYAELIGKYYFREMSERTELPKPEIKAPVVEAGHRAGETEAEAPPTSGLWARLSANGVRRVMVGQVDVSYVAGLRYGDLGDRAIALFGKPLLGIESDQVEFGRPDFFFHIGWTCPGFPDRPCSPQSNQIRSIAIDEKALEFIRSHVGSDSVLDLLGKPAQVVLNLLGAASDTSSGWWSYKFWINGQPGELAVQIRGRKCTNIGVLWPE